MRKTFSILLVLFLTVCLELSAKTTKREATISWRAMRNADSYEIHLGKNSKLYPLLFRSRVKGLRIKIRLKPGTYYFRVRALDLRANAGPWSDVEGFVVYPSPPLLVYPRPKESIDAISEKGWIVFQWKTTFKEEPDEVEYAIEIRDRTGVQYFRSTTEKFAEWRPTKAGHYRWRVGHATEVGTDWSGYRRFAISERALASYRETSMEQTRLSILREAGFFTRTQYLSFQIGAIAAFQSEGRSIYSSMVSWNPTFYFSSRFGLRANLGVTLFKMQEDEKLFPAIEYALSMLFKPARIGMELGLGAQTWVNYGTYGLVTGTFSWIPRNRILWIDRVFIGYSTLFLPTELSHQVKAGIGFSFDSEN